MLIQNTLLEDLSINMQSCRKSYAGSISAEPGMGSAARSISQISYSSYDSYGVIDVAAAYSTH